MIKSVLLAFVTIAVVNAQLYVPGDTGSSVKFRIKNLGVNITGSFSGLQGKILFDPANPASSSIEASIDASSINTGIDLRDDHLRKEEYFDVKNHPRIKFVSTSVFANRAGSYTVKGLLTIKNTTKEITVPFKAAPQEGGFLFSGEFKINRRDFGVGGSSITMSDNLTVLLSVFAARG